MGEMETRTKRFRFVSWFAATIWGLPQNRYVSNLAHRIDKNSVSHVSVSEIRRNQCTVSLELTKHTAKHPEKRMKHPGSNSKASVRVRRFLLQKKLPLFFSNKLWRNFETNRELGCCAAALLFFLQFSHQ